MIGDTFGKKSVASPEPGTGIAEKIRHCAFCLVEIQPSSEALKNVCKGCHRRAYCSEKCRKDDLDKNIRSQRHDIWCELHCGEEDVDWAITRIPGRGHGVVALKEIPPHFRIMVDWSRSVTDPLIKTLVPEGGTFTQISRRNSINVKNGVYLIFLRVSRINHSCEANSSYFYDRETKVMIIVSKRRILVGEEITIQYYGFTEMKRCRDMKTYRDVLKSEHGIVCPQNCKCRLETFELTLKEARLLHDEIEEDAISSDRIPTPEIQFAPKIDKWLEYSKELDSPLFDIMKKLLAGYYLGVMKACTLSSAIGYITQLIDLFESIYPPESQVLKQWKEWRDYPEDHFNYMELERRAQYYPIEDVDEF